MNLDVDLLVDEIKSAYQCSEKSYSTSSLFEKSTDKAIELRNLGNKWYKEGQENEALNFYTQSIASALCGSEELALAYANRSAVLLRIQKFELCLLDVNRALTGNYPENLEAKLHQRKQRCLNEIKSRNESKMNITTNKESVYEVFFPTLAKTREIRGDEADPDDLIDDNPKNLSSLCTTRKIELQFDEKWGTSMIASTDIGAGEILSIEQVFSSISIVEREYRNCSFCFITCEALIPCHYCTRVLYCGKRCRKLAFDSYHRIECRIWPYCLNEKLNAYELLALRSLLVGVSQRARLFGTVAKSISFDIFKEQITLSDEIYVNNYLSVLRLCRNKILNRPSKEIIQKAVRVVCMLKRESFFEKDPRNQEDSLSEAELCATVLLINHFASMELNNFVVSETFCVNDKFCEENVLGFAISPLHNTINHSCDPNVGDIMRRREHVLFALRPIKCGEKILLSYGVSFSKNSVAERAKKLSAYGFTCDCDACKHKWPLLKELRGRRPKFLTRNKNVIDDVRRMNEIVFCEEARTSEALENAVKFRKMLHMNVKPPSLMIVLCEDLIFGIMKSLGNFYSEYENSD